MHKIRKLVLVLANLRCTAKVQKRARKQFTIPTRVRLYGTM